MLLYSLLFSLLFSFSLQAEECFDGLPNNTEITYGNAIKIYQFREQDYTNGGDAAQIFYRLANQTNIPEERSLYLGKFSEAVFNYTLALHFNSKSFTQLQEKKKACLLLSLESHWKEIKNYYLKYGFTNDEKIHSLFKNWENFKIYIFNDSKDEQKRMAPHFYWYAASRLEYQKMIGVSSTLDYVPGLFNLFYAMTYLNESIDYFGPTRYLGELDFKAPRRYGGDKDGAFGLYDEVFKKTKIPGGNTSFDGRTVLAYALVVKKVVGKKEARKILADFINYNWEQFSHERKPELYYELILASFYYDQLK